MKEAIREYYDSLKPKEDIALQTLKRVKEERLRRWKLLSLVLFGINLLLAGYLVRSLFEERVYEPMSAGVEVVVIEGVSFSKVHEFLKRHGLTIEGPIKEGTYFIKSQEGRDIRELLKASELFKVR